MLTFAVWWMVDYYPNKSVDELLLILTSVQKRASEGVLSMTSAAGIQQLRSYQGSGSTQLEIKRLLYSLHRRSPADYPNPYCDQVRRTGTSYFRMG